MGVLPLREVVKGNDALTLAHCKHRVEWDTMISYGMITLKLTLLFKNEPGQLTEKVVHS